MSEEKVSASPSIKDANENKYIAILSYIWILFLIPLLLRRDSKFCQLHAKQGMILFIASLLSWFPIIGQILGIAILIISLIGILKVSSGEYWKIPYIHEWSEKFKM